MAYQMKPISSAASSAATRSEIRPVVAPRCPSSCATSGVEGAASMPIRASSARSTDDAQRISSRLELQRRGQESGLSSCARARCPSSCATDRVERLDAAEPSSCAILARHRLCGWRRVVGIGGSSSRLDLPPSETPPPSRQRGRRRPCQSPRRGPSLSGERAEEVASASASRFHLQPVPCLHAEVVGRARRARAKPLAWHSMYVVGLVVDCTHMPRSTCTRHVVIRPRMCGWRFSSIAT